MGWTWGAGRWPHLRSLIVLEIIEAVALGPNQLELTCCDGRKWPSYLLEPGAC